MADRSPVELLSIVHDLTGFTCGDHKSLDLWLERHALANQSNGSSRTYVVHRRNAVIGYYAICAGSIARENATGRAAHGLANHPVPVSLLARLAVHRDEQGSGLGKAMLKDALLRMERAADILGIRAVLVHAIDGRARAFYEKFDFEPCPDDELHLMLLMKDLRKQMRDL